LVAPPTVLQTPVIDDFGGFGDASVSQAALAKPEAYAGDLGSFAAAPDAKLAGSGQVGLPGVPTGQLGAGADEFGGFAGSAAPPHGGGGFGTFGGTPADPDTFGMFGVAAPLETTTTPPSGIAALGSLPPDMFGGEVSAPTPSTSATSGAPIQDVGFGGLGEGTGGGAAIGGDGFGGFGGASSSPAGGDDISGPRGASSSAPGTNGSSGIGGASALATDAFGSIGDASVSASASDYFGGIGDQPVSAPTVGHIGSIGGQPVSTLTTDGFSGFGGPPVSATTDDFGGFSGPSMSAPITEEFDSFSSTPCGGPAGADGFGGFGGASSTGASVGVGPSSFAGTASVGEANADDFGGFGTVSLSGAAAGADDFGGFRGTSLGDGSAAADDFSGFGGAPMAPHTDGDGFAGFGGAPAGANNFRGCAQTSQSIPAQDSFGAFGVSAGTADSPAALSGGAMLGGVGTCSSPSAENFGTSSTVAADEDGFGDFGVSSAPALQGTSGGGMELGDNSFGGFDGGATPSALPASGDDFCGFDDFGAASQPGSQSVGPLDVNAFGGLSDVSRAPVAAAATDSDDFGGFGGPNPEASSAPSDEFAGFGGSGGGPMGAGAMDADDFGGFCGPGLQMGLAQAACVDKTAAFGSQSAAGLRNAAPLAADDFGGFEAPAGAASTTVNDGVGGFAGPEGGPPAGAADLGIFGGPSVRASSCSDDFAPFGGSASIAAAASGGFGSFAGNGSAGGGVGDAAPTVGHSSDADFGDFGGIGGLSLSLADNDGFGGFGEGVSCAAPQAPSAAGGDLFDSGIPGLAPAAPSGALSTDLFGGAAWTDSAAGGNDLGRVEAGQYAAVADDNFCGFGGVNSTTESLTGADTAFGDFSSQPSAADSVGDFSGGLTGAAVNPSGVGSPPAAVPASGDDDFDDFGDFDGPSPPVATGFASLVANDDDSFSSIEVRKPPGAFDSPVPSASPVPGDVPAAGVFDGVFSELLKAERYEEALACKQHLEAVAEMAVQQKAYEVAKANDELEEAIHIKKTILPALRSKLQPDSVVESWSRPVASPFATIAALTQRATAALGVAEAAPFVRSCPDNLHSLAATNLDAAAARQRRARAACELLLEIPAARQKRQLEVLDKLASGIVARMGSVADALASFPSSASSAERSSAMRSPRVTETMAALAEMRKLGLLIISSRDWHASFFVASATAGSPMAANTSAQAVNDAFRRAAAATEAKDEVPGEVDRYWEAPRKLSERCALSLAPLQSDGFGDVPQTVAWEGQRFHAPCINFWVHNIDRQCPAF